MTTEGKQRGRKAMLHLQKSKKKDEGVGITTNLLITLSAYPLYSKFLILFLVSFSFYLQHSTY